MDETTGQYSWQVENVENADAININQLDIPIQQNESVQIRIKSLSEAGYPSNPLESDYSEVVTINFPQELIQPDTTSSIISQNEKALATVQINQDLQEKGVDTHIANSFTANGKYFAHPSTDISSGFLSPEQTPINLFDALTTLQNRIAQLEQFIQRSRGELSVTILDNNGVTTAIKKDTLTTLFAGYYSQDVANFNIRKGAIVSKNYFIRLSNVKATALELISKISGSRSKRAYASGGKFGANSTPGSGMDFFVQNDTYYTSRGKYDYVPISFSQPGNPTTLPVTGYTLESQISNISTERQSSQSRGQYIYSRYRDIGNTEDFYIDYNIDNSSDIIGLNPLVTDLTDAEYTLRNTFYNQVGTTTTDFIWNGNYSSGNPLTTNVSDATVSSDYLSGNILLAHVNHPNVQAGDLLATLTNSIRMAKAATKISTDIDGKKQTAFFYSPTFGNTIKSSFVPNDQYLLGKASCGSYMFLLPREEDSLTVNGDDALSVKAIIIGEGNAISIPLVFQYRMTDYYGLGVNGLGAIGGDYTGVTTDVIFSKKIGLDLFDIDENRFSFDLEIFAKYAVDKLNINSIPSISIANALKDLTSNIPGTQPNINLTTTNPLTGK